MKGEYMQAKQTIIFSCKTWLKIAKVKASEVRFIIKQKRNSLHKIQITNNTNDEKYHALIYLMLKQKIYK